MLEQGTACSEAGCQALLTSAPLFLTGYSSRRVQSPSSKSNDTLSGISSIEPSKHSGSSHSLASVRAGKEGRVPATASGLSPWLPIWV